MKLLEPSSPAYPRKKAIHEWCEDERPREKFMALGGTKLSSAELLAILVGSGNAQEDAVALMQRLLDDCSNSLRILGRRSIEELCAYNGIGPAKAITILAACELGTRHENEQFCPQRFGDAQSIYRYFYKKMRGLSVEEVHALFLNQSLGFIRSVLISKGGLNTSTIDVRVILREALVCDAVHIVVCHNHPSGNSLPSLQDDEVTDKIRQACTTMHLKLLDHLILTDGSYFSYAEKGLL